MKWREFISKIEDLRPPKHRGRGCGWNTRRTMGKSCSSLVAKDGFTIDQEEIKEFVKAELRSSRVPQLMVVWDELPYNETGKLLRRVVREELSK